MQDLAQSERTIKKSIGINVYEAAKLRLEYIFDQFPKIYLSFSGGKDSSVMLHMAMSIAKERNRKIGVLFVDLEAQYTSTINYIEQTLGEYKDHIELYWVALPLSLRNAVSQFEPKWQCWDADQKDIWVRNPPKCAITDVNYFPFFTRGMEFEDFIQCFGHWYAQEDLTACLVGIRADESLNRFRTIMADTQGYQKTHWTTWKGHGLYNAYPIYDWRTKDIWAFNGKFSKPYNKIYDLMNAAGVSIHQARICQPYGDDQRRGLWLYHILEPELWPRIVCRVNGVNSGALYSQEKGNINGRIKISKPVGHTWQSYVNFLLESMPEQSKIHYENKIAVFLKWYQDRGYPLGIPDEASVEEEANRTRPSWRRVCKVLLKNDWWCKGLGFGQHKAESYDRYLKIMKKRRSKWGI